MCVRVCTRVLQVSCRHMGNYSIKQATDECLSLYETQNVFVLSTDFCHRVAEGR